MPFTVSVSAFRRLTNSVVRFPLGAPGSAPPSPLLRMREAWRCDTRPSRRALLARPAGLPPPAILGKSPDRRRTSVNFELKMAWRLKHNSQENNILKHFFRVEFFRA
ncbi:hypothetical protein [Massilia rubra]|uniref:Uncharacterized protein n=1 Tax=Massilia rubra TaxID=2607910 RepID=A0ABX0LHK8_9BURK|nr:hypothetical protein [Massilia rubra]NHZ32148.1 hypothetical protein [Massilia rubra]